MAFRVKTKGGHKFSEVLKEARKAGSKVVEVGIYADAVYPDGVQVALVGLLYEYGLAGHVETGWFRSAVAETRDELKKKKIRTMARGGGLGDKDAEAIATMAVTRIQDSIRQQELIDTGRLF